MKKFIATAFLLLVSMLFTSGCINESVYPVNGVLSLDNWNGKPAVSLGGEWELYRERFYLGKDFNTPDAFNAREIIQLHQSCNKSQAGKWQSPEYGYATLRMTAYLNDYKEKELYLFIPGYDYAVKIYCNGKEIFTNGSDGKFRWNSLPVQYCTVPVSLSTENGRVELVIHLFAIHGRNARISDAVVIGNKDTIAGYAGFIFSTGMFITGLLSIIILYNIFLILIRKFEALSFYFLIFCISTLVNLFSCGTLISINSTIQWKTSYYLNSLSLFALFISFYLYTTSLFSMGRYKRFSIVVIITNGVLISLNILLPAEIYSRFDFAEQITGIVIMLFCMGIAVKAVIRKKELAVTYLVSSVILFLCIINYYFKILNITQSRYILLTGSVLFIIAQVMILTKRNVSGLHYNASLINELKKKNDELDTVNVNLVNIIKEKTSELDQQMKIIRENDAIVKSNNLELEKRIKEAIDDLHKKDEAMILNSRLASLGEMIGFIGHQWKQNIYAISLYTEALKNILQKRGVLDFDTAGEPLGKIDSFIIEMYNNLNDFTDFIKPKKDTESFSITGAVDETLLLMRDFITINSVELIKDYKNEIFLKGFSNELKQVVMNLVKNSIDAFGERKIKDRMIVISTQVVDRKAFLSIRDNAGGIQHENPDSVFDKFYTSKDDGTGLGLYLSRIVIEQRFNGRIEVYNTDGGASFNISIPVSAEDIIF